MKVFLYIRVACADQLAAADQREELERYAKDKGYEVAAAVAADGISGVHTEGIMNFLLNEAKRQDIGTILTRDTSRISRDTSSFMRFERKFRENGIRFEYLSKPDNELPVTPMMEAFETASSIRRPGGFVIRRQKCPNLFMLWGYVIPSPQAVAGISMG